MIRVIPPNRTYLYGWISDNRRIVCCGWSLHVSPTAGGSTIGGNTGSSSSSGPSRELNLHFQKPTVPIKIRFYLIEITFSSRISYANGVITLSIGRYEREEVNPSIKLAEALQISLDYLVGVTDILLDKNIVNRVLDIQRLNEEDKKHVFALLDAFIKQRKLQAIL